MTEVSTDKQRMIIVDVGSTTTKALLFEQSEQRWRLAHRGEAPTTVESPFENVQVGVRQAIGILEAVSGLQLLAGTVTDSPGVLLSKEVNSFYATSSAGGGLKVVVCGNVRKLSALSAERAALGAGAILLDVFGTDDGLSQFQRLERLRDVHPDMILLSGGVEGANIINFIIEMCDFIRSVKPKSRYATQHKLPVIYAGSSSAAPIVEDLLAEAFHVQVVANLKPNFEHENLEPTRNAIHDVFIEHVMSNAPGYQLLKECVDAPILPTPSAVGDILTHYARKRHMNILCVDIGGATTDVFSVLQGNFMRSVSANYGMSYSIGNVLHSAGYERVERWLEEPMPEAELMRRVGNKLFNPTTIPAVALDLRVEQAAAREALRMSFADHQAVGQISERRSIFGSSLVSKQEEIRIGDFDILIGSGGVLSNAPQRAQAAAMLIDAFQPVGVTELMVDSVFMLPHLGAFSQMDEASALHIAEQDCLVPLGTVLAPEGIFANSQLGMTLRGVTSSGRSLDCTVHIGQVQCIPLAANETADIQLALHNGVQWQGKTNFSVRGGRVGIIVDLRGRPLPLEDSGMRYLAAWREAFEQHVGEEE